MNNGYPLFPVAFLVILSYALSYILVRLGLLSKVNHRKFWNSSLLIVFLVTGLAGLVMVLKINYKLTIPFYTKLLDFHVDFGIGMAILGLIHFWWHLSYYLGLLRKEKGLKASPVMVVENDLNNPQLKLSAFLLGSTSLIAQVILLREFLSVFNGNELVIGLVLANWMIITGVGALLGASPLKITKSSTVVISGLLILSVLPIVTTFLINFLKNRLFPMGAMISLSQIFLTSLILLIPFCLLSGFLFTTISRSFSEINKKNNAGFAYGFESAGSVAGGLLSGLLLIFVFSTVESLLAMTIINSLLLFLISLKNEGRKLAGWSLAIILSTFGLLFMQPEKMIRSWVYPNQVVEVSKDSPYGNIVITRRGKMWSVYNNNVLLFDSENFMTDEETVHFAMVQHPHPSHVLLVSGGIPGQLEELKKYQLTSIDYVEDNRWLWGLMKDSLDKIMTKNMTLYKTDPQFFIRKTNNKYDVVLLNLQSPSTLQSNRFYTVEFFSQLKEKLNREAVITFGLPAPVNYLNDEAVSVNSTLYVTLKKVFNNVIIIPGEKNYFIASDSPLTYNIAEAIQQRGIQNRYVNSDYINDRSLKYRGETILSSLDQSAKINTNMKPLLYRQQVSYWLSFFKGKYWWMALVAGIMAFFIFLKGSIPSKAMFISGFSATGMELLLLFGLQVFYGNIYLLTSFVFSGFMAGMAAGSFIGLRIKNVKKRDYLLTNQLTIGFFTILTGLLLFSPKMALLQPYLVYTCFLAATVVTGLLTGFQFTQASLVTKGHYGQIPAKTYSYDLVGSAFGALATTLYMVPGWGIHASVIIIGSMNILFGIVLTLKKI